MDIMNRIQLLPQELQDEIFQYTLLAELPYGVRESWVRPRPSPFMVKVTYTCSVPRLKTTLSCLISYMNEILQANKGFGLEYAQATLCIVRLFVMFDLFEHVGIGFFEPHLQYRSEHRSILDASGFMRLHMLRSLCRFRGDSNTLPYRLCVCDLCWRFDLSIEYFPKLCFEDVPTFLLRTITSLLHGPYCPLPFGLSDDDFFFEVHDGKVQALFIWEHVTKPWIWLSRVGEPWTLTYKAGTVKHYDEYGRGGVVEWDLENDHYEVEFSNVWSINYNIDAYLCSFDKAGIQKANQARNDSDYAREQKRERRRGKTVAAMSKEERAKRITREGRFWCLA